jgi:hypothetical protein
MPPSFRQSKRGIVQVKVRFVSTAETELKEALAFYESAHKGLDEEFPVEVEAATHLIESFHWLGHRCLPEPAAAACIAFHTAFFANCAATKS